MIRVGTSGYSYPEWRGTFYAERFPTARMLPYYAERFDTVELNNTFYRLPTAKAIASWDEDTPPGFVFALKASRRITHLARLRGVAEPVGHLVETARALGAKLGPLLFQLPPNLRKDTGRLGACLSLVPPGVRVAFEFRHESWFDEDVYRVLRAGNAALCIADTEAGTTPVLATADFGYLRLRDRQYTREELLGWAATARRPEWRDAFVYFKHEESGTGPALTRELLALLDATPGSRSAVPETLP